MRKDLSILIFIISLTSCKNNNEKVQHIKVLSEDTINLYIQEYIISNIDSLIEWENSDCENTWSELPYADDFRWSKCFSVIQKKDNEFNRFRKARGFDMDLIYWNPSLDDGFWNTMFHSIDYWILDNTIVRGDLNSDKIEDYAIKVLKKPKGNALGMWITDWYFLISSNSSYTIKKNNLFNGTYLEPNYDVTQIKEDTIIGNYQHYNTFKLPFDSQSIIDTSNLLVYKYSINEFSFTEQDFYIIPFLTTSKKQKAKEIQFILNEKNLNAGYLWLPDFYSLSDKKQYVAFVGPFSNEEMCKSRLVELKKDAIFKDSYGILVSEYNERKEIRIN
jgi:hypothetical protein